MLCGSRKRPLYKARGANVRSQISHFVSHENNNYDPNGKLIGREGIHLFFIFSFRYGTLFKGRIMI